MVRLSATTADQGNRSRSARYLIGSTFLTPLIPFVALAIVPIDPALAGTDDPSLELVLDSTTSSESASQQCLPSGFVEVIFTDIQTGSITRRQETNETCDPDSFDPTGGGSSGAPSNADLIQNYGAVADRASSIFVSGLVGGGDGFGRDPLFGLIGDGRSPRPQPVPLASSNAIQEPNPAVQAETNKDPCDTPRARRLRRFVDELTIRRQGFEVQRHDLIGAQRNIERLRELIARAERQLQAELERCREEQEQALLESILSAPRQPRKPRDTSNCDPERLAAARKRHDQLQDQFDEIADSRQGAFGRPPIYTDDEERRMDELQSQIDEAFSQVLELENDCPEENPLSPEEEAQADLGICREALFELESRLALQLEDLDSLDSEGSDLVEAEAEIEAEIAELRALIEARSQQCTDFEKQLKQIQSQSSAVDRNAPKFAFSGSPLPFALQAPIAVAFTPYASSEGAVINITDTAEERRWLLYFASRFSGLDDHIPGGEISSELLTLTLGAGVKVGPNTALGAELSYRTGEVESAALQSEVDGNYLAGSVRMAHRLSDNVKLSAVAGYVRGENDLLLDNGALNIGSFDVEAFSAKATLQASVPLGPVTLLPTLNGSFDRIDREGFDTFGLLPIPQNTFSSARISAGLNLDHDIGFDLGSGTLKPTAGLFADYRDRDDAGSLLSNGQNFRDPGLGVRAMLGADWELANGGRFRIGGEFGHYGSDFQVYSISVSYQVPIG